MHKYKSSPLLTFERKLSFNRKTDRQRKRVRFQSTKRDACGVRNPFAKHCGEINFLPQELLQFISSMQCLTYKIVGELEYGDSKDFSRDIGSMQMAVRWQQCSLEGIRDMIRRSQIKPESEKENEPEQEQNYSHFYDQDSKELFPIAEVGEVSFSLDGDNNNLVGLDSTDTEKPRNFCYTEALLPMGRNECDMFFAE